MAQYRCGLTAEALATLTRSIGLNKHSEPAELAFLALARHPLGQSEKARDTLGRLREVMKDSQRAGNLAGRSCTLTLKTVDSSYCREM